VLACARGALRGDRMLYDHLGSARAHLPLRGLGQPFGVWIHGIEVWDDLRQDRLRAAKCAGFMIANTHYTRQRAAEQDKTFERAGVCWLATAEDEPPEIPAKLDGAPTVLILGRLDVGRKGHQELIEAWPSVTAAVPGARLVIVGTGPMLEACRSEAKASPAAGNIDVLGFVPQEEISRLWRAAVVFAMPSRCEGFGIVYIEAMRWGIPVIASVHDAGTEINAHGETGFNVDLARPGELADSMVALLRDRDMAKKLGAGGQARWREHFRYTAFRERFGRELQRFVES
jgi:phosphatidylinositol alpha-1,6-mannosyltransferase